LRADTLEGVPRSRPSRSTRPTHRLRRTPTRSRERRPEAGDLTIETILAWANRFHAKTGKWPRTSSGRIAGRRETWEAIDLALRKGLQGLPGGSSLSMLLHGPRNLRRRKPLLTADVIFGWAEDHFRRTGRWPRMVDGPVASAPGETWKKVNEALWEGFRGLEGGSSLKLLLRSRGITYDDQARPVLQPKQVLDWAKAFHREQGTWPFKKSGPIRDAPGETWEAIDRALKQGARGLPRTRSLRHFLVSCGLLWSPTGLKPQLVPSRILAWADAFYRRHGCWPQATSGPIEGENESWQGIELALHRGKRGLKGSASLSRFLNKHRKIFAGGKRRPYTRKLSLGRIRAWAKKHRERTGEWPHRGSGPVPRAARLSWQAVDDALRKGRRGLPGGSSLAKLFGPKKQGSRPS